MSELPASPGPVALPAPPQRYPWYRWRRWGLNFLTVSILAHLLLAFGATYLIVQSSQARRKQTFAGAPAAANAPRQALEHKVQMQRKQQTMSAPAAVKRVTTTSNAKVALPVLPAMPRLDPTVMPLTMAGMGGTGVGLSLGGGGGGGGVGGDGGGINLFGVRTGGVGLVGTFYDLKQTPGRQPTEMTPSIYGKVIAEFVKGGFSVGVLNRYFKSDKPIYATQIWIPQIPADLGPAAFGLEKVVQPKMWCVHYKGRVIAPGSFTFHFVGAGDDVMVVKFNGREVLSRCWYVDTGWKPLADYQYHFSGIPHGFAKGDAITVEAGQVYPMEVIIGEQPGGRSFATLLQEVDGTVYEKDRYDNPILPVFRLSNARPASDSPDRRYPPHRDDGPVWKSEPARDSGDASSIFSH